MYGQAGGHRRLAAETCRRDKTASPSRSPHSAGDGGKELDWLEVILQAFLTRQNTPDFGKVFLLDCFLLWVSCWTQRARSYLGTGVGDRVGQAFPEGSVCFLSAILGRGRFWLREREGGPLTKKG